MNLFLRLLVTRRKEDVNHPLGMARFTNLRTFASLRRRGGAIMREVNVKARGINGTLMTCDVQLYV